MRGVLLALLMSGCAVNAAENEGTEGAVSANPRIVVAKDCSVYTVHSEFSEDDIALAKQAAFDWTSVPETKGLFSFRFASKGEPQANACAVVLRYDPPVGFGGYTSRTADTCGKPVQVSIRMMHRETHPEAWAQAILDERWLSTLTHEFGHMLGLEHSGDKSRVMYAGQDRWPHPSIADRTALAEVWACPKP